MEPSIRGLPPVALLSLALGVVVAAIELWPIVTAWSLGVTEWWSELPQRLPVAARSGAMLMLPAAVAWGTPDRERRNRWLWTGALIVAATQLLRYPVNVGSRWLYTTLIEGGTDPSDPLVTVIGLGIALVLAVGSVLGIWALGEGLKDSGGRSEVAVVVALVVTIAFGLLLGIPSIMAGLRVDLEVVGVAGVARREPPVPVRGRVLAGRAVAGALNGARPAGAWRAGAIAAVVLWVLPILSLVTLLVSSFVLVDEPLSIPYLGVATYFGWPLFAVALALGMGRLPVRSPIAVGSSFLVAGHGPLHARRLTGRRPRSGQVAQPALPLRVRRPFHRVPVPVMRLGLGHVGHRRLRFGVGCVGDRRLRDGPCRRRGLGGRCLREVGRGLGGPGGVGGRLRGLQRLGGGIDCRIGRDSPAAGDGCGLLGRAPVCQGPRRRRRSLVVGHRMPPSRRAVVMGVGRLRPASRISNSGPPRTPAGHHEPREEGAPGVRGKGTEDAPSLASPGDGSDVSVDRCGDCRGGPDAATRYSRTPRDARLAVVDGRRDRLIRGRKGWPSDPQWSRATTTSLGAPGSRCR